MSLRNPIPAGPDSNGDHKGLRCPKCDWGKYKVKKKLFWWRRTNRRHYECQNCGNQFPTEEKALIFEPREKQIE